MLALECPQDFFFFQLHKLFWSTWCYYILTHCHPEAAACSAKQLTVTSPTWLRAAAGLLPVSSDSSRQHQALQGEPGPKGEVGPFACKIKEGKSNSVLN